MKRLTLILSAFLLLATVFASAQLTIDASGPIRERRRLPTGGSGGGTGRKLPINVAMEVRKDKQNTEGEALATFVITNSGKDKLTVPISPNPGDMEPEGREASYTLSRLTLYVTSDRAQSRLLSPLTNLYGSQTFSGTLTTLAPGESLRVLGRVKLPVESSKAETSAPVFVAHIILSTETVKTISGRTVSDSQEIGSASSSEYTAQSLAGANH